MRGGDVRLEGTSAWTGDGPAGCLTYGERGGAGEALVGLRAGDMVLFPAWQRHFVPALGAGSARRVNVSFNARVEVGAPVAGAQGGAPLGRSGSPLLDVAFRVVAPTAGEG